MKVAITGAHGFLGWHIRVRCKAAGIEVVPIGRAEMANEQTLDSAVAGSDMVIHAAGVNRAPTEEQIAEDNLWLAEQLASSLRRTDSSAVLVYTNSTKSTDDSTYGRAKRAAAESLATCQVERGAPMVDLVLPNIFGEFGLPDYNSAVATFAHRLATGAEADVNRDGEVELVHAQDVAEKILQCASGPTGQVRVAGRTTTVGDIWDLLTSQHERYVKESTVPSFADRFELRMFNTLRSQLFGSDFYPQSLTVHSDERGGFAELCRADGVGQTSVSTSAPEITRGDHFHFDKIERFIVTGGSAVIRLRRVCTDDVITYRVDGSEPVFVDMPTLTTHNITNSGDGELTTVFWSGDHFDPDNPDTIPEKVQVAS